LAFWNWSALRLRCSIRHCIAGSFGRFDHLLCSAGAGPYRVRFHCRPDTARDYFTFLMPSAPRAAGRGDYTLEVCNRERASGHTTEVTSGRHTADRFVAIKTAPSVNVASIGLMPQGMRPQPGRTSGRTRPKLDRLRKLGNNGWTSRNASLRSPVCYMDVRKTYSEIRNMETRASNTLKCSAPCHARRGKIDQHPFGSLAVPLERDPELCAPALRPVRLFEDARHTAYSRTCASRRK
jgi:hypothetical protein